MRASSFLFLAYIMLLMGYDVDDHDNDVFGTNREVICGAVEVGISFAVMSKIYAFWDDLMETLKQFEEFF